jgi:hypothetical protein
LLAWLIAFAGLFALVIDRFDLMTVWRTVQMPDGSVVRLANGWYTVDHPFHISRAHTLLEAVRSGELLRWFGQHQGGYPAEFYPTGAAWLDVALWAITLGALPMEVVHKLLIGVIVVAPAFIFLWWAWRDRLSPGVALLAGTGHVVIAGEWWSGGWTEVALWGLVTNVAAQTAILGALVGVLGWLHQGRSRDLGFAVLFAGLALGTNPRTALGLVAIGLAAVIVSLLEPSDKDLKRVLRRGIVLVTLSFAVAAPVLISLIRFRELYYFVHYSGYSNVSAWWASSQKAVWEPIIWFALLGIFTGILRPGRLVTRTVAIAAAMYMVATASMAASGAGVFEQLELTRLMPFQRMLLFYLAAIAVHDLIACAIKVGARFAMQDRTVPSESHYRLWTSAVLGLLAFATMYVVVLQPAGWVPLEQRGLRDIGSSAHPATRDFEQAVRFADAEAPEGTSILVLGTVLSWHQGLTAPMWSERRFFYDDWLWYWQRDHVGPYNPETEHAYPRDTATLTPEYFALHGIGAVIVTDVPGQDNREIAATSPLLTLANRGAWFDVLLVNDPVPIVTSGASAADAITINDSSISAVGISDGGTILIRHNWHPRWQARVNGASVDIVKRADGYMAVTVPDGPYDLRLTYSVTLFDWLARALFVGGALIALALIAGRPRRIVHRLTQWNPDQVRT